MVHNCCVKECKSFWYPNTNLSFFRFPYKRPEVAAQWSLVVPGRGKISKSSVICSKHFAQSDFQHEGFRRTLKDIAVPSIFPSGELAKISPETSEGVRNAVTEAKTCPSDRNTTEPCKLNMTEPCEPKEVLTDSINVTCPEESIEVDPPVILENSERLEHPRPQLTTILAPPNYIAIPRQRVEAMRRQILLLQRKNRQLDRKYRNVTELVKRLKKSDKCTADLDKVLMRRYCNFNRELFKSEMYNTHVKKNQRRYTDKMKEFAMTIYLYSPKTYRFLRTVLHLPEESVFRRIT